MSEYYTDVIVMCCIYHGMIYIVTEVRLKKLWGIIRETFNIELH